MNKIKNVIFDIGNILIDYRWIDMIMELGVTRDEARQIGREIFHSPEWADRFDRGTVNEDEICHILAEKYPEHKDAFWWVIHHPERMPLPRPDVWAKVKELKDRGYRLFYLSNYSSYLLDVHTQDMPWPEWMDGGILSCDVHLIKPEPEIYKALLDTYNLKAEECFFIDDVEKNIIGGKALGIDGFVADNKEKLLSILDELANITQRV